MRVIFSTRPAKVIREQVFGRHKPTGYLLNGVQNAAVWLVRAETLSIIALFTVLFWLLDLHWQNTLKAACLLLRLQLVNAPLYQAMRLVIGI